MIRNQLIIEQTGISYELDLFENVPIPLNKSINDVANISERKTDFTKTIKLPGTNNNNDIFSNIFNIARTIKNATTTNFNPDFNPSLKANCTLYKNGIPQIKGYLQLTNIEVVDDYQIEYEIIIIGRFANLFSDIADKKLSELNLSEYDHPYNITSVENSWTGPIGEGYYYGLIDYGYTSNPNSYPFSSMLPQIYAKTIIDKIFSEAGFRYSSTFFDSDFFKKLVVPYSEKALRLSASDVEDRLFSVNRNIDTGILTITTFRYVVPFNNVEKDSDPSGWDVFTDGFIVQNSGQQNFVTNLKLNVSNPLSLSRGYEVRVGITKNGAPITVQTVPLPVSIPAFGSVNVDFSLQTGNINVVAGDIIRVELFNFFYTITPNYITILGGSNFFNVHSGLIIEGDTLPISALLPNDINQTDFLSSIIKMFNLYVDVDKLDDKKLIIEPYNTFYTNTLVDLTQQVDVSRGVNISPLGALDYKSYKYTFTKDDDYLNKRHQSIFADTYGFYGQKIENDFVKDEFVQEVIFAPRPLTKFGDKIITQIIFKDSNGNRTDSPAKISLLTVNPDVAFTTVDFTIVSLNGTTNTYTLVPYVGHLDDPYDPSYDINFGTPKQLYYTTTVYTNSSLFNVFHKKYLDEITDPNSKIVEYYVKISDIGLNQLSFRYTYLIDKQYYRLYELDSDLNSEEPAKVKFLKLKLAPEFIGIQGLINGGISGEEPIFDKQFQRNGNVNEFYADQTIQGNDNNIQGDKLIVNSDTNIVNATKVNVLSGGGNTVSNNDVTLIGTNDYVTFRDGQTVINGVDEPIYYSQILTHTELTSLHETPVTILPVYDGYWTEVYDAYATLYFEDATPVAYNSHAVRLKYSTTSNSDYLASMDNAFIAKVLASKVRASIITEKIFQSDSIVMFSQGDLGGSGNGLLKIEVHYRLHQIAR